MITGDKIKQLVDGKINNQHIIAIVRANALIPPSVPLNVYLNLGMDFVLVQSGIIKSDKNILTKENNPDEGIAVNNYFFKTTLKNYERNFGKYHPTKILMFEPTPNKGN
jgi:hypothetical protein